jgi:signal transduction histidine kinase
MEGDFDSHEWLENTKHDSNYPLSLLERACRGEGENFLQKGSFVLPYIYGNHYRGVFLIGPHSSDVLGIQETKRVTLRREIGFSVLSRILSNIINSALSQRDKDIERMNRLWAHTIRTELHHGLFGEVSIIDSTLNSKSISQEDLERARLSVSRIKDTLRVMKIQTRFAKGTVEAAISNLIDAKELSKEQCSLLFVVRNCVERMEQSAKQVGITVVVDESLEKIYSVEIDIRLMTIVFENILDNAIKYAKSGKQIRINGEIDILRRAVVRIENFGRGIHEYDRRRVFDFGYRGRNVHDRGGDGLGLFQVQNILKAHGGEVSVSSRPAYKDAPIHSDYITTITIILPTKLS